MFATPRSKVPTILQIAFALGAAIGDGGSLSVFDRAALAASQDPAAQTTQPAATSVAGKPNILLYIVDTTRADELACYGAKITRTPNFDRFAGEGVLFENASALATATRPSMASLITGVPGEVHGAQRGQKDGQSLLTQSKELACVPEILREQGYYTGAIIANPNLAKAFGFDRGFDVFEQIFALYTDEIDPQNEMRRLISDAPIVVEKIRQFIDNAPPDKPYFLFVLSIDPHDPYSPPAPFEKMYDPQADGPRDSSLEALNKIHEQIGLGQRPSLDRLRALYRAEITYADHHFGKLMDWMRETGRIDKTLVVLTADHGEEFLEHGQRGHGKSVFEELSHIPMILRYPPSFEAGRRDPAPIDMLDLSATLVAVAGGKKPPFWVGRDLRRPLVPRPIFTTQRRTPSVFQAVRFDGHKMIRDDSLGKTNYYYLPDDPGELNPLTGDARAAAATLLAPKLRDFVRVTAALHKTVKAGNAELRDTDLPPDVLRALKALGYVDDE